MQLLSADGAEFWIYTKKVDKCDIIKNIKKPDKWGAGKMSEKSPKYTPEFKQTIVNLYHSGKTYNQIKEEYGVSHNALANWIKQYSEVKLDDSTVLTARQIKELQKRNAQLEEENLILKKAIAIFTPHSNKDWKPLSCYPVNIKSLLSAGY